MYKLTPEMELTGVPLNPVLKVTGQRGGQKPGLLITARVFNRPVGIFSEKDLTPMFPANSYLKEAAHRIYLHPWALRLQLLLLLGPVLTLALRADTAPGSVMG